MARISNDQIENYSKGGGAFFSLKDGESANVRILFNTYSEIPTYTVHEFNQNNNYATIDCARLEAEEPVSNCKWCSMGNPRVTRTILALYNEDTQSVQYWKRSGKWLNTELKPYLDEIPAGQPISGQIYKIKRTGKDMQNTKYTLFPVGSNDLKTPAMLGEVKDPFSLNIIKNADCDFDPNAAAASQPTQQATRRTVDVF